MLLSSRIKNIRIRLNISQRYIAKNLGVSQQAYSYLENNADRASSDSIKKIALILGVCESFMFTIDVPVTETTLRIFQNHKMSDIVSFAINSDSFSVDAKITS